MLAVVLGEITLAKPHQLRPSDRARNPQNFSDGVDRLIAAGLEHSKDADVELCHRMAGSRSGSLGAPGDRIFRL